MSNIYICGDVHGNFKEVEWWLKHFAKTGNIFLHLGDFGCGFVHDKKIESLANKFSDAGCRCLVVAGNHDEPIYFTENRKFSGGAIEFLPKTHFRKINDKGFLFLGGAISVDRYQRIEGRSWWRDEKFVLEEEYLKSVRGVDYIIAHSCPFYAKPLVTHKNGIVDYYSQFDKTLIKDLEEEGKLLAKAVDIVKKENYIKGYYFGHFHCSERREIEGIKFRCFNIDEIDII